MSSQGRHTRTSSQISSRSIRSAFRSLHSSPLPSDRSTLPSSRVSARPSKLPVKFEAIDWDRSGELREIELMKSQLLQWTLLNGEAARAENRYRRRLEEETFDRGKQVLEMLPERLKLDLDADQAQRTKLLYDVVDLESTHLSSLEEEILQASDYILDLQTASLRSLNRLSVDIGPEKFVFDRLRTAKHCLERIYTRLREFNPASEELLGLAEGLGETLEEERTEIVQAMLCFAHLRSLYALQRQWLLARSS